MKTTTLKCFCRKEQVKGRRGTEQTENVQEVIKSSQNYFYCAANRDFSLVWLLAFTKSFAWLVCCVAGLFDVLIFAFQLLKAETITTGLNKPKGMLALDIFVIKTPSIVSAMEKSVPA